MGEVELQGYDFNDTEIEIEYLAIPDALNKISTD